MRRDIFLEEVMTIGGAERSQDRTGEPTAGIHDEVLSWLDQQWQRVTNDQRSHGAALLAEKSGVGVSTIFQRWKESTNGWVWPITLSAYTVLSWANVREQLVAAAMAAPAGRRGLSAFEYVRRWFVAEVARRLLAAQGAELEMQLALQSRFLDWGHVSEEPGTIAAWLRVQTSADLKNAAGEAYEWLSFFLTPELGVATHESAWREVWKKMRPSLPSEKTHEARWKSERQALAEVKSFLKIVTASGVKLALVMDGWEVLADEPRLMRTAAFTAVRLMNETTGLLIVVGLNEDRWRQMFGQAVPESLIAKTRSVCRRVGGLRDAEARVLIQHQIRRTESEWGSDAVFAQASERADFDQKIEAWLKSTAAPSAREVLRAARDVWQSSRGVGEESERLWVDERSKVAAKERLTTATQEARIKPLASFLDGDEEETESLLGDDMLSSLQDALTGFGDETETVSPLLALSENKEDAKNLNLPTAQTFAQFRERVDQLMQARDKKRRSS